MSKINSILGFSSNNNRNKGENILKIRVKDIVPNPDQPRKFFNDENLRELASSIKQYGVIQPVLVKRLDSKKYQLIAGERRFRASQLANMETIPAIVKSFSENEVAELALIENLQRENLNYFEEAEGYQKLMQKFNLTQEEIAKRVGKSQSTIANKLRILKFSPEVKKEISVEVLSERHLRALLKLKTDQEKLNILEKIYQNNLNVKQTEKLIEDIINVKSISPVNDSKFFTNDHRLYINSIKKSLRDIEKTGVKVEFNDEDKEGFTEITIRMYK